MYSNDILKKSHLRQLKLPLLTKSQNFSEYFTYLNMIIISFITTIGSFFMTIGSFITTVGSFITAVVSFTSEKGRRVFASK